MSPNWQYHGNITLTRQWQLSSASTNIYWKFESSLVPYPKAFWKWQGLIAVVYPDSPSPVFHNIRRFYPNPDPIIWTVDPLPIYSQWAIGLLSTVYFDTETTWTVSIASS